MALVVRAGKRESRILITAVAVALVAAVAYAAPPISGNRAAAPTVLQPGGEQAPPAGQQQPQAPPAGQQQEQTPAAQAPGTLPGAPELLTPEEREALALVEQLIRDQEGVMMGTGFDYVEEGRRDPFRSLIAAITAVGDGGGERPFGLPGFNIDELDLTAVAEVQGRWHAMVTAPDQRSYFLEVGTELWDGHVVSIGQGEVVFEQIVPDFGTGARRTRQVTKRLRTTDGGWETPR